MGMIESLKSFFSKKKILITGHTGFIGSWLAIWLNELGAEITGYALKPNTNIDNYVVTNIENKITSVIADIRNFEKLDETVKMFQPEIIYHLAAQPIVRKSYLEPKITYDINIGGTINVLEAFRKNIKKGLLINFTSDKCYQNKEWIWGYREKDRLGGDDPYSASKACSEIVTNAYIKSFFQTKINDNQIGMATVRCGNIIGGGDWQEDRLVPDCFRSIKNNKNLVLRNPHSIRPWQYVLEPILGILILAKCLFENSNKFSGSWNFGPSNTLNFTTLDLVKKIFNYFGKGNYEYSPNEALNFFNETKTLLLDCNKARKYLGWIPILNMDEIIEFTCNWYKETNINYDYDVQQIKQYINKINFLNINHIL